MKKVTKAQAFDALIEIVDRMCMNVNASSIITVTRFIEQQWEPEEQTETIQMNGEELPEVTAKSEGTI